MAPAAFRTAGYLRSLIQHSLIVPTPSLALDALYAPTSTSSTISHVVLARIPHFSKTFDLGPSVEVEMGRAIEQAQQRAQVQKDRVTKDSGKEE